MESRRWGSIAAFFLAAITLIPSAGQKSIATHSLHGYSAKSPLLLQWTESKPVMTEWTETVPVSSSAPIEVHEQNRKNEQTQPIGFKQSLRCVLTAYTAGFESTGKRPGDPGYGITASGKHARENQTIAVDPKLIPMGTRVYIEGIGYRVAEDTGGAVKGAHIDIFFNDPQTAIQFGIKRNVAVYVLES